MGTSRRDFIKKGSLVALVAGVPMTLVERAAAATEIAAPAAFGLNKAAFSAQLNSTFLINEGAAKVAVRLVDVSDLPRRGAKGGREGFSLLFKGDKAALLKQDTYLIEHEKLGMFSFLVVPVMSKDKRALHYEAIINHLHP
jgi:hypothetical protein